MTRKLIIVVAPVIILLTIFFYLRHFNHEANDIDHLQHLVQNVRKVVPSSKYIYYVSNSNSEELYLKTQFALVPNVVLNYRYEDIPRDSCMLIVQNKMTFYYTKNMNTNESYIIADSIARDSNILLSDSDRLFTITLLKKK